MAEGDIDVVIDTLEFEASYLQELDMVHVSGDVYAIVYRGPDNDGWIKTVSVDSAGNIGAAVIDSQEFDGDRCYEPRIIHVYGTVFAIAYGGPDYDGFVKTINISAAGDIGPGVLDTLEYDTSSSSTQFIVHVTGTIYAIAYCSSSNVGKVVTFNISNTGVLDPAVIEQSTILAADMVQPEMIHVHGIYYAIVYKDDDSDGRVLTFTISNIGEIGGSIVDSLEFDTAGCDEPTIIHIADDIYAVAYKDFNSDGHLVTFSISDAGDVGAAVIDSFIYDATQGLHPYIIPVSGDVYTIVYTGDGADGFVTTVSIDADGNIGAAVIDSFEFETVNAKTCCMVHISGDVYAIAFVDTGNHGQLKTIGVETIIATGDPHLMLIGVG